MIASRSGLLYAYKGNHFFANKQISCCFFFLFREEFFWGVQSIPLPKIRQLNKHFFYLCSLLVYPCRAAALQGLMRALLIIKLYPIPYPLPQSRHIVRRMQINMLLLDGAPETLYPYIIFATSPAIHRNTDMIIRQ